MKVMINDIKVEAEASVIREILGVNIPIQKVEPKTKIIPVITPCNIETL